VGYLVPSVERFLGYVERSRSGADPRAGAGASVEADVGGGKVPIGWELAEAEGVTRSFVNRLLRIAFYSCRIGEWFSAAAAKGIQLEERAMVGSWDERRGW
jgi:hypothetical protein